MHKLIFIAIFSIFLFSCEEEAPEQPKEVNWTKDDSYNLGRDVAANEEIKIRLFLEMHKDWELTQTGTGLRYYVYEKGEGPTPKRGQTAEIEYVVSLLDGTECYRTEDDEYEELLVDRSDVETGVQEALKLLSVGDRAKLIIPSHIGHGLLGDQDKIPPLTTLVVDIYLMGIR
ncbi:MAG: FKBP-type peptidyl-prolyl cis-trans isomerase [Crocinitomicaceae bacterium]